MEPWLSPAGETLGRWMAHVEEWMRDGKKGGGPPGTRQTGKYEASPREREYVALRAWYLLRPEVYCASRFNFHVLMST